MATAETRPMTRAGVAGLAMLLAMAGAAHAAPSPPETRELLGQAYDRRTGTLLYSEHHRQRLHNGKLLEHHVEYLWPDGTRFATKTLDYAAHPYAPAFRILDLRDAYIEGAEHAAGGYQLLRGNESALERARIALRDDLVSDSGFDAYARDNLPALIEGRSLSFRLAVAGRLADYGFRAERLRRENLFGRDALTIRVTADSLLRWLVDPLEITYDIESRQLLRYVGLSNLRSPSGERYDARIDFVPAAARAGSPPYSADRAAGS